MVAKVESAFRLILSPAPSLARLIINEGLEIGSQIEYIRRARAAGYAVVVTNTNLNTFESTRSLRRQTAHSIRVCTRANRDISQDNVFL